MNRRRLQNVHTSFARFHAALYLPTLFLVLSKFIRDTESNGGAAHLHRLFPSHKACDRAHTLGHYTLIAAATLAWLMHASIIILAVLPRIYAALHDYYINYVALHISHECVMIITKLVNVARMAATVCHISHATAGKMLICSAHIK